MSAPVTNSRINAHISNCKTSQGNKQKKGVKQYSLFTSMDICKVDSVINYKYTGTLILQNYCEYKTETGVWMKTLFIVKT